MTRAQQTWELILSLNGTMHYNDQGVWEMPKNGSVIHRITPETAQRISTIAKREALKRPQVPLTVALANWAVESKCDPLALNKNLMGSNPQNAVGGYDVGIGQFKVRYHGDVAPGKDEAGVRVALCDPERAIPYYFRYMAGLVAVARGTTWQRTADRRATNPFFSALTMYKQGPSAGMKQLQAGTAPDYGLTVAKWEREVAQQLGYASVMADVT